ncbi:MAG: aminopeptidase P family protein [Caldilineaceae bacterium]|nr:aminopeptidase P family protein [Caldilineaceae bacterium]
MGEYADLAERDRRLARTRSAMEAAGLDALIVVGKGHWWTGRGYIRYFTDFHIWGHDGLLCIPLNDEPFMVFSSYAVAERIAARGWVTDVRGDVYQAPRLVEMMRQKGVTRGRIGIAGRRYILSAGNYDILADGLPEVDFVDADDLMDRVRSVKSALEVRQIREHWVLTKAAMERFVEAIEPGKSQRELAAEASAVALAGGARDMLVFIGERPDELDPPRDVPVRCDDILRYHMEICGESGHWSEITVNCAFREPTDMEYKLVESELRALDAITPMAKPGARLSELASLFEETLRADGWDIGSPTTHFDFHGQGMDTIERPWHAAESPWGQSQDWVLEAGMVFSYHPRRIVEPAPGWSTGINEDVLITEQGLERFGNGWSHRWRVM